MKIVSLEEASARLSQLVDQAISGESFVIAKADKQLVKVEACSPFEPGHAKRLGFMAGQLQVPEDFDQMGSDAINSLFGTSA